MTRGKTLRVALAGTGYIAAIHAQAVMNYQAKQNPGGDFEGGVELVAVVARHSGKTAEFARKFHINHRFENIEEAMKKGGFDALVIGTPNYLHAPQAIAALRAGVHVLVEKPMAMNSAECEGMLQASQKSGATLMVAHCWRFDEDVLWLKERVHRLGKIIRSKGYGVHTRWGPAGWFTQKNLAGGGAVADMGIHALDTVCFLLGDPQPVSVYAHIGTYYKDFDVDDTGVMLVNWDNGTVSYIESGWWQPHSDGAEAATQLYGTEGFGQLFPTYALLPTEASVSSAGQGDPERVEAGFPFPRQQHCPQILYDRQMAYFFDCIHSGQTPVPGGQEGLINMRIVDAAYESARIGSVVKL